MRNSKKVCYTSSYDRVDIQGRKKYNNSYENRISLWSLSEVFSRLCKSKARRVIFLLKSLQVRVEQNSRRLLEGKEDVREISIKDVFESYKRFWEEQPTLERRTKNRQGRVYTYFVPVKPKRRLSWLRSGTSSGNGKEAGKIFNINGGGSPLKS